MELSIGWFCPAPVNVWPSSPLHSVLITKQLLDLIYYSLELLEEFPDCETDVFVRFQPPQRLSLNNISLHVDMAFVSTPLGGLTEGVVICPWDQQNMSSLWTQIDPEAVWYSGVTCLFQFSLERLFVRSQGHVGKGDLDRQRGRCIAQMHGDVVK